MKTYLRVVTATTERRPVEVKKNIPEGATHVMHRGEQCRVLSVIYDPDQNTKTVTIHDGTTGYAASICD